MAEPTLLEQARYFLDASRTRQIGDGLLVTQVQVDQVREAVVRILQHLQAPPLALRTVGQRVTPEEAARIDLFVRENFDRAQQKTGEVAAKLDAESERRARLGPQVAPERLATFPALPIDGEDEALVDRLIAEHHEMAGVAVPRDVTSTVTMHDYELAPGESLPLPNGLVTNRGTAKVFLNLRTGVVRAEPERVAEDDLDALEKLCDAACSGPWTIEPNSCEPFVRNADRCVVCEVDADDFPGSAHQRDQLKRANGVFIAAARDALPKLIAEVRRLRAKPVCSDCNALRLGARCGSCGEFIDDRDTEDADGIYGF